MMANMGKADSRDESHVTDAYNADWRLIIRHADQPPVSVQNE
jgi:hypothetical protein